MACVNKVIIIGYLGKDPELKYTQGGQPVASFSVATTERFKDKNGQDNEKTEWHNIVAWGKLAELTNQYLKNGSLVYVEGKLSTRSWDDQNGNKHYKTEITVNNLQFLPSGNTGSNQSNQSHSNSPSNQQTVEEDLPF